MSHMKTVSRRHHLQKYIQSDGDILPPRFWEFDCTRRQQCVFCHVDTESTFTIPMTGFIHDKTSLVRSCHCIVCGYCKQSIKIYQKNKAQNREEYLFKLKKMSYSHLSKEANTRLVDYVTTGLFPPDGYTYCVGNPNGGQCIFCDNLTNSTEVATTISPPQGQFNGILGFARVCASCSWHKDGLVATAPVVFADVIETPCCHCGQPYSITAEEYEGRVLENTIGGHKCDSCLISVDKLLNSERVLAVNCASLSCSNKAWPDLTLDTHALHEQSFCKECSDIRRMNNNVSETSSSRYVYSTQHPNLFIILQRIENTNKWIGILKRIDNEKGNITKTIADTTELFPGGLDDSSIACLVISQIYENNYNTQLSLY